MNKIINWHKTYIGENRYVSMHFDMAIKLQKLDKVLTFEEYSRMFNCEGLCHLNEESYNSMIE